MSEGSRGRELDFRQQTVIAIDRTSERLGQIDVKLAKISERLISRETVAQIVLKEMDSTIKDVARIERILWGTIGTFLGTIIVTAIGILVTKALH